LVIGARQAGASGAKGGDNSSAFRQRNDPPAARSKRGDAK